jgi:hypothetical protein
VTDREVVLATGTAPGPTRGRVREFVANRSGSQRVGAIAAVLVLMTAPFGGLRSATDPDPDRLELGQKIDLGPFYVTVNSVKQHTELPPVVEKDPTSRILAIRITVTNHTDRAEFSSLAADAFAGEHIGAIPWPYDTEALPRVYDVDDAGQVPPGEYINPDQTYTYALLLRQRPDADLDALSLSIYGYAFVEEDVQTLDPNRWDLVTDRPLVEGHVPVEVVP